MRGLHALFLELCMILLDKAVNILCGDCMVKMEVVD